MRARTLVAWRLAHHLTFARSARVGNCVRSSNATGGVSRRNNSPRNLPALVIQMLKTRFSRLRVHRIREVGYAFLDAQTRLGAALIDALTGPLYFRRIIGHAPVTEAFASELASRVLQAFRRPVGL